MGELSLEYFITQKENIFLFIPNLIGEFVDCSNSLNSFVNSSFAKRFFLCPSFSANRIF